MNISRSTLSLVLLFVGIMILVPGQLFAQDAPPPPYDIPEGHTYINPNPGISAPGSTDTGGVGTNTVTGSRGYGDAYLTTLGQSITGYGVTWLNQSVSSQHNICAQMVTLDVNGASQASTPAYSCTNATSNGNITSQATANNVACGSFVAVRTNHRIEQTGYLWEDDDIDGYPSFCG